MLSKDAKKCWVLSSIENRGLSMQYEVFFDEEEARKKYLEVRKEHFSVSLNPATVSEPQSRKDWGSHIACDC